MSKILILLVLLVSVFPLFGQDSSDSLKFKSIETRDGNTYIGRVLSETGDSVVFKTEKLGILRFSKTDILGLPFLGVTVPIK